MFHLQPVSLVTTCDAMHKLFGTVIILALMAGFIEAASMIPYLAATGFLNVSELSLMGRSEVLLAIVW